MSDDKLTGRSDPLADGPTAAAEAVAGDRNVPGGIADTRAALAAETPPGERPERIPNVSNTVIREILRGSVVTTILAIVAAFIIGGILIAVTDDNVQKTAGYFFARPGDMLAAVWHAVSNGYYALFRGSIVDPQAQNFIRFIRPFTNTLSFAVPLILAGLGVGLAFRVGLFNIGAQGQMLIAGVFAGFLSFQMDLPMWLHIPLTIIVAALGGALWGFIAGFLKARTGAHEVILTIMLNWIALNLVGFLVRTPGLQKPGSNQSQSVPTPESAQLPPLFGPQLPGLNVGLVVVIIITIIVWWLMERSALGFRMRAVGQNPLAARAAGISVPRMYVYAMVFAGALAGVAGSYQVTVVTTSGFNNAFDAGIGFSAITVALLGRSRAGGVFAAGLLFGALKAGSFGMAGQGIPAEIVTVVQSIIVLFIAAPPLVRSIFFLPKTDVELAAIARAKSERAAKKASKQNEKVVSA
ncbi:ABC transporter permease [Microbacterium gorillae]|uniref:ABC transporter permease n=1 Tax=Microbacterium gorillae TaxID=1231063 RepID=UPI000AD0D76D|nr:ABC transporter permease [Microbacterium gorillae]